MRCMTFRNTVEAVRYPKARRLMAECTSAPQTRAPGFSMQLPTRPKTTPKRPWHDAPWSFLPRGVRICARFRVRVVFLLPHSFRVL